MAPNRKPEQNPPHESESEEGSSEREGSGAETETETDSESEGEEEQAQGKIPIGAQSTKSPPPTPAKPQTSSSSEDSEGSETDSDVPNANIKPLASKPMESPRKSKKDKKPTSVTASQDNPRPAKRAVENDKAEDVKDSKKSKKTTVEESSKKQPLQRLWSEDDEIAILNGLIDYAAKKGIDEVMSADMNDFHEFMKKSLHVDVSKTQLHDKVRRLKGKYKKNVNEDAMGKDQTFSKAHDQKAYELSEKIWGGDKDCEAGDDHANANKTPKKNLGRRATKSAAASSPAPIMDMDSAEDNTNVVLSCPFRVGDDVLRKGFGEIISDGLNVINWTQRKALGKSREKLVVREMELYLQRLDFVYEQNKLALEAWKSSRLPH